jgi:protein-L-isoaspartate(D-aspartate) O-methyltransferase
LRRREFLTGATAACLTTPALAAVPTPFAQELWPDMGSREAFVAWMKQHRGEDANYLGQRWDRYLQLISHSDVWDAADKRAFLMTPREEFVTAENLTRAYEWHHLNIGFGVTITGPHTVARMTNTLAVKPGDKVLEIGAGSGHQSAYLSYLTDKLWSIEIPPPLAKRTRGIYDALIARGYREFAAIKTKNADGYYGWEDSAPFDKIIVTCGIDHIPPPLLQQLKPGGIRVIPVGPPGYYGDSITVLR